MDVTVSPDLARRIGAIAGRHTSRATGVPTRGLDRRVRRCDQPRRPSSSAPGSPADPQEKTLCPAAPACAKSRAPQRRRLPLDARGPAAKTHACASR